MKNLFHDKDFWVDALERAIKTFCQTLAATLTVSTTEILNIDWTGALAVAGLAALVSVLTSVGSYKLGEEGTASAV